MDIMNIVMVYIAFLLVVLLHELGHIPKYIKWNWGIFPHAAAMQARSRLGGLVVNIVLFIAIAYYKPEMLLLQYVGLIAWAHFIVYAVVGSVVPEPRQVNIKTYIFDDVPNEHGFLFVLSAMVAFLLFQGYYIPIFEAIL